MADQQSSLSGTPSSTSPRQYNGDTTPDEIRRDIEKTRRDMDETVDELEGRLRPRHLLDEVLGFVRNRGGDGTGVAKERAKQAGQSALNIARDHPIPLALIGAGVAWLIFEQKKGHRFPQRFRRSHLESEYDEEESSFYEPHYSSSDYEYRGFESTEASALEVEGEGSSSGHGKISHAAERARHAKERLRERTARAREAARLRAHAARERMRHGYDVARQRAWEYSDEYPLALGAAALAAGVLAGLAIPHTRREDEWLGEYSDRVKERARERGHDVVERGRRVARTAAEAAREESERQGIGPQSLNQKMRDEKDTLGGKVKSVVDAGKEAAREEMRGH